MSATEQGTLWNHQVQGIRTAESSPDLGLFFEQGTGKTRTLIEILRRRYAKASRIRRTLILCPKIVCYNWKSEFKKYSKINQSHIVILKGSQKDRIATLARARQMYGDNLILITNYESMDMDELYRTINLWEPEILVCDESQRLKNHSSKRAKKVVELADLSSNNYILSGTPVLDGKGMDIFMQFRILDRGATFGKNFFSFRATYFIDKNAGMPKAKHFPLWIPNPLTAAMFQKNIASKSLRVLKKDCLDLPPFVRQVVHDSLTPEQARMYREMKNEFITWLKDQEGQPRAVVAKLAVTKMLRLQQIVTGFAKDENGQIVRLPNTREDVLQELLEDIPPDKKIIVWAVHRENYVQIAEVCKRVGRTYRELHGAVQSDNYADNVRDFCNDPEVTVLIANQGAGGVGINLVEAQYAIYYSKDFKLENDLQSEARNYRGGSERHDTVIRIDITTPGTVDELIDNRLKNKQDEGEALLDFNEECI